MQQKTAKKAEITPELATLRKISATLDEILATLQRLAGVK